MANILESDFHYRGPRGYSNYELAVHNGYKGSEAEWLEEQKQGAFEIYKMDFDREYQNQVNLLDKYVHDKTDEAMGTLDREIAKVTNGQIDLDPNAEVIQARAGFDTLGKNLKQKIYHFNNVKEMCECRNLESSDIVQTLGYYSENDNGGAIYKITTIDNKDSNAIKLDNNYYANLINETEISINQLGANSDEINDNTEIIKSALNNNNVIKVNDGNYLVEMDLVNDINKKYTDKVTGNGNLEFKYLGYNDEEKKCLVPVSALRKDEFYKSMILPAEKLGVVRETWTPRYKGQRQQTIIETKPDNADENYKPAFLPIGAIYRNRDSDLPENFTFCIGKIKCFIFRKSTAKWEILTELMHPTTDMALYRETWDSNETRKPTIKEFYDHIEVPLTKEQFENNVLHFWGRMSEVQDVDDILYMSSAYEFWIKEEGYGDYFIATSGIDTYWKYNNSTLTRPGYMQLFYGRFLSLDNVSRMCAGNNVPETVYDKYVNDDLKILFDKNVVVDDLTRTDIKQMSSSSKISTKFMYLTNRNKFFLKNEDSEELLKAILINETHMLNLPTTDLPDKYVKVGEITLDVSGTNVLELKYCSANSSSLSRGDFLIKCTASKLGVSEIRVITSNLYNITADKFVICEYTNSAINIYVKCQQWRDTNVNIREVIQNTSTNYFVPNVVLLKQTIHHGLTINDSEFNSQIIDLNEIAGTQYTYTL